MAENRRVLGWMISAAVAVVGVVGCTQTPARPAGNDRIKPTYDNKSGQLERITYDRNGDGKVDATTFMRGAAVVRAELDENFDGVIDRREHYAAGNTATRALEKVESTTRTDGKITRWETYENGVRTAVREDSDADGRVDKWETWEAGTLRVVAMDTRGRGRPDRRLVYPVSGDVPRLEVDDSGSGTFTPVIHKP